MNGNGVNAISHYVWGHLDVWDNNYLKFYPKHDAQRQVAYL